jgi:serine protease
MTLPDDDIEVMELDTEEEIRYWQEQDDVEYVEPDGKIYLHESLINQEEENENEHTEVIPWGVNAIKALNLSNNSMRNKNGVTSSTGSSSNQKVCIIDTGIDIQHPDLPSSNKIVAGTTQIEFESWDQDGHGHGTHVAGTISAIGGNGQGIVGVTQNHSYEEEEDSTNSNNQVELHIVKMFDNGGRFTYTSSLIQAIESCVEAGSTVVNMSIGGPDYSAIADAVFSRIYNSGVLLVAAAGNGGSTAKSYPASYSSVISVAATDINNEHAWFSQRNGEVDLAAPGVGVLSTIPGNQYFSLDGTSMASPHVAGVAALLWSYFPEKNAKEIRAALESTALDLGIPGRDDEFGHGLVQADLAYEFLGKEKTFSTSVPSSVPSSPPSSAPPSSDDVLPTMCGCSSCTSEVYNKKIARYEVSESIDWIMSNFDVSEEYACTFVCGDRFPEICGQCDPTQCNQ